MTGALHAHRRFTLPAVAPIFNNVVVIGAYLLYASMRGSQAPSVSGVTTGEVLVLGLGTTLGVVAMTVCLVPQLSALGWRLRWSFDPSHPAVRRAARLGVWALSYAGGYQAGLIVVLILANRIAGGVAAYQWAYTLFFVPHALFGMPIFSVLFPAMAEHVARKEDEHFVARLQDGLNMLAFILVPVGALMFAAAGPIARLTLQYGAMTGSGTALVARVISAFAIGLPAYSAFLVLTRAYYAFGDTKTPAIVNAGTVAAASAIGAGLFVTLSDRWAVAGLAFGHSVAFVAGSAVLGRGLWRLLETPRHTWLSRSVLRSTLVGLGTLAAMVAARALLPDTTRVDAALSLVVTVGVGGLVYAGAMRALGAPELGAMVGLARRTRR
jgi:putative peptidoglycan lipid II flippase